MNVRHIKTDNFNKCYEKLPKNVKEAADRQFKLLKENPQHPSLEFRQLSSRSDCWYARVTQDYRTLATKYKNVYIWFWIGTHARFNVLTARPKNLVPNKLPLDRVEQGGPSLSLMSLENKEQLSTEDVNSAELNKLIREAISDFNENRYEE